MYRSILVPLDGSTFGEHALPVARGIAHQTGANLRLVYVYVPFSQMYLEDKAVLEAVTQIKEHQRAYLDEMAKRLAADSEISVTATMLDGKPGQVAETLIDYVVATQIDLIVLTTHGYGTLARFWLGSIADKLIRQAPKPILLVRSKEEAPLYFSREQVFQHILIPLDGSTLAEQILEHAVALGQPMQAKYRLLRVLEPIPPIGYPSIPLDLDPQIRGRIEAEAQAYLDGIAEQLRGRSFQVQTQLVIHQQPAIAILEDAKQNGVDLIAMETHGRGGLKRLLIGSVADKVLRGSPVPVLLHHPQNESSSR